jgi:hypothetical protein
MNAHVKLSQDMNEDKDASKQTQIALVQSNDSNIRVSRRDIADLLFDSSSEDLIIGLTKQINEFR